MYKRQVLRYWEEELELDIPRNEMGHRYYTDLHIRLFKQVKNLSLIHIYAESDYTAHVFSRQLEDARVAAGMQPVPWNIISSLDATDIPFDHLLFKTKRCV